MDFNLQDTSDFHVKLGPVKAITVQNGKVQPVGICFWQHTDNLLEDAQPYFSRFNYCPHTQDRLGGDLLDNYIQYFPRFGAANELQSCFDVADAVIFLL